LDNNQQKVAIMQPYFFPYIGYFHLIAASDIFVFYDDVNFIKKGWIHRNQMLLGKEAYKFTIPLLAASQNKLINETEIFWESGFAEKWLNQLESSYKNAPNYQEVRLLIEKVLSNKDQNLASLAIHSILLTCEYLGLNKVFHKSSDLGISKDAGRAERLIEITKHFNCTQYINAVNGQELYNKPDFKEMGVDLSFVAPKIISYKQGGQTEFIPYLSIIDVLMWNKKEEILSVLFAYDII